MIELIERVYRKVLRDYHWVGGKERAGAQVCDKYLRLNIYPVPTHTYQAERCRDGAPPYANGLCEWESGSNETGDPPYPQNA